MANKDELKTLLKIDEKMAEITKIQAEMNEPSFWRNSQNANERVQKLSALQKEIKEYQEADSPEDLAALELKTLLSEKYDENNAILSIHAGAGGTEAQDWAEMLLRMFERFAERRGYKYEILEISAGEEVGIKSVTVKIAGMYAFGYLKSEAGVHRLVRLSPFDADKARHTSFALVEVIPEIDNNQEIEIPEKDIRVDVYRAGGHGGQGVNTTDSAVRLTHIPTNIVVSCQNERSQLQNKAVALKILQSRVFALKLKKQKEDEAKLRGEHLSTSFGSQIRSYVLHPYQQVKDHRTDITSTNPQSVLGGNIDGFIEGYLKRNKSLNN